MIIEPGTVEIFFDLIKNPLAFTEGANYQWGEFKVGNEICSITSEGKTLIGTMNPKTKREFMIFSTNIETTPNVKQGVAITWDSKELKLYFNGQLLHSEKIADYLS